MRSTLYMILLLLAPVLGIATILEPTVTACAYEDASYYYGSKNPHNILSGTSCYTTFTQGEGIAYRFNLENVSKITAIAGSMFYDDQYDNIGVTTLDLVLYKGSIYHEHYGLIPVDPFFQQAFSVNAEGPYATRVENYDWHGVSGLNLSLAAGTYWLAFENGNFKTSIRPGVRLEIDSTVVPSTVPEPATLALLGVGLAGMGNVARRRKR